MRQAFDGPRIARRCLSRPSISRASGTEIEAETTQPVVLRLEADGAEASAVIGDATGTTVVYFPAGYAEAGVGSLQSVGDPAGADRDGRLSRTTRVDEHWLSSAADREYPHRQ
jgi:hypothetical protein